jgi:hypothetical protein
MNPEPSRGIERRRAVRFQARNMFGVVASTNSIRKMEVIDCSRSGLRVRSLVPGSTWPGDGAFSASLFRGTQAQVVRVQVRPVRQNEDDELGLEIVSMDAVSRGVYQAWLSDMANTPPV